MSKLNSGTNEAVETVNHPAHYNAHPSGVEAISICENLSFNIGNAVKYLFRADHKGNTLDDLRKAAWYLKRAADQGECSTVNLLAAFRIDQVVAADHDSLLSRVLFEIGAAAVSLGPALRRAHTMVQEEIGKRGAAR